MGQSAPEGDGLIAGINGTPLVDIVLVLLLIFIVTAKIIVAPAVPLDLPHALSTEETQVVFSVILTRGGQLLVNGSPVSDDATLLGLAAQAVTKDRELRAVINADGEVAHRRVLHTLDLLKRAGLAHVAFGALPEAGEAATETK